VSLQKNGYQRYLASDFELDGANENSVYGGNFSPSSLWSEPELVHQEHKIHPFHADCTKAAPDNTNLTNWFGDSIYK